MKKRNIFGVSFFISLLISCLLGFNVFCEDDVTALKQENEQLKQKINQLEGALAAAQSAPKEAANRDAYGWNPYLEMDDIRARMNRMFDDSFNRAQQQQHNIVNTQLRNALAIRDENGVYIIDVELPGMEKDAINIEAVGRKLQITAERKSLMKDAGDNFQSKKESFGFVSKSILLPTDSDTSKVDAEYKNGILTVKVGKLKSNKSEPAKEKIKIR